MKYRSEKKDDALFMYLEGDLIGENSGLDLVSKINDVIEEGVINCVTDISGLRYINSSGIGVLITILTKLRNKGGELVLVKPSENVKKLLIITKLNAIFTICEDEEEALKKLKI